MDFTNKGTSSTPELTSEIAEAIYGEIKTHGNADLAFKAQTDSIHEPEHYKLVDKEADRIVKELNEFKNGKLLEAEESHYDEESGEKVVDKEAVYYEYTTDEDLIAQVSSDYLDVETVFNDLVKE